MKQIIMLCMFLVVYRAQGQAPDWAWARQTGTGNNDEVSSMAVDGAGNVYATGYYSGSSLSLGSVTLTNSGSARQFFIIKYNRAGVVQWAKSAGGTDDEEGRSLAVDGSGNIYVCGNFESASVNFGNGVLNNKSNAGQPDIFLVKYSPAGAVIWAKTFGGSLQESANALDVDASGNVCMTGNFFSLSVLFGNFGVINSGVSDAFVARFNSSGVALWAKRIGGGQTDNGNAVGTDNAGNVYVTGDYNSNTVSSFSPALSNSGGFDIYLAKYDAQGNLMFASRFGGSGDENATAMNVQGNGIFFLSGYFESGSLTFGSTSLAKTGTRTMFITRFNSAGTAQWAKKATGNQSSIPEQLAGDGSSIFMAGSFDLATLSFGSHSLNNGGSLDGFVVSYDAATGNAQWARGTGSPALEQFFALAVGGGYVHAGGIFTGTLVLRDNTLNNTGATDGFVTKLCFAPAGPLSASGATACPGSPVTLTGSTPAGTSPVWFTAATGGSTVHQGSNYQVQSGNTFYLASRDTNSGCGMYSSSRIAASGATYPAVNASVSISGHTLIASGNGTVTAWYDCVMSQTIGSSNTNFVLDTSGTFAVIMVSQQGCVDTSGCNSYSYTPGKDSVIVTPEDTTDVPTIVRSQQADELRLFVYPNPSQGEFNLRSNQPVNISIVNALGQTVHRALIKDEKGGNLLLGPLPAGLYFIVPEHRRAILRLVVLE